MKMMKIGDIPGKAFSGLCVWDKHIHGNFVDNWIKALEIRKNSFVCAIKCIKHVTAVTAGHNERLMSIWLAVRKLLDRYVSIVWFVRR